MSPKAFIASFAASTILLVSLYTFAFTSALSAPIAAEYWLRGTLLVKEQLAAVADKPKVVLVGGSSTLFSVGAEAISSALGRPVINLGTHAGLPLSYHLDIAKRSLRPGDTVVVIPEYGYYRQTDPNTAWFINQVFAWDSDFFRDAGFLQKLQFVAATPAKTAMNAGIAKLLSARILHLKPERGPLSAQQVLEVFWAGVASAKVHSPQRRAFQYFYNNLNEYGDILNTVGSLSPAPQDYGLTAEAPVADTIWRELQAFKAYCNERGIAVFLAYAPIMSAGPVLEKRAQIEHTMALLADEAKAHDLTFIDTPESAFFPAEAFFDTSFHLNTHGRDSRSAYLARRLSLVSSGTLLSARSRL